MQQQTKYTAEQNIAVLLLKRLLHITKTLQHDSIRNAARTPEFTKSNWKVDVTFELETETHYFGDSSSQIDARWLDTSPQCPFSVASRSFSMLYVSVEYWN